MRLWPCPVHITEALTSLLVGMRASNFCLSHLGFILNFLPFLKSPRTNKKPLPDGSHFHSEQSVAPLRTLQKLEAAIPIQLVPSPGLRAAAGSSSSRIFWGQVWLWYLLSFQACSSLLWWNLGRSLPSWRVLSDTTSRDIPI